MLYHIKFNRIITLKSKNTSIFILAVGMNPEISHGRKHFKSKESYTFTLKTSYVDVKSKTAFNRNFGPVGPFFYSYSIPIHSFY